MIRRIKNWLDERRWMAVCDKAAANPKSYDEEEGITML